MRRTPVTQKFFGWHYLSPITRIPDEYAQRLCNSKQVVLTDKRDPKNKWGLHNVERLSVHPSVWGGDRHNYANGENKGGAICDLPPVPVYKEKIWCMGHYQYKFHHPRIFIKVPRGKVVSCKWCRLKFVNMATDDDNDDDWEQRMNRINTTPETMEQLMVPYRRLNGQLSQSNFQDGKPPHPEVYKTVYDPNVFYAKYAPERMKQAQVEGGDHKLEAGDEHKHEHGPNCSHAHH